MRFVFVLALLCAASHAARLDRTRALQQELNTLQHEVSNELQAQEPITITIGIVMAVLAATNAATGVAEKGLAKGTATALEADRATRRQVLAAAKFQQCVALEASVANFTSQIDRLLKKDVEIVVKGAKHNRTVGQLLNCPVGAACVQLVNIRRRLELSMTVMCSNNSAAVLSAMDDLSSVTDALIGTNLGKTIAENKLTAQAAMEKLKATPAELLAHPEKFSEQLAAITAPVSGTGIGTLDFSTLAAPVTDVAKEAVTTVAAPVVDAAKSVVAGVAADAALGTVTFIGGGIYSLCSIGSNLGKIVTNSQNYFAEQEAISLDHTMQEIELRRAFCKLGLISLQGEAAVLNAEQSIAKLAPSSAKLTRSLSIGPAAGTMAASVTRFRDNQCPDIIGWPITVAQSPADILRVHAPAATQPRVLYDVRLVQHKRGAAHDCKALGDSWVSATNLAGAAHEPFNQNSDSTSTRYRLCLTFNESAAPTKGHVVTGITTFKNERSFSLTGVFVGNTFSQTDGAKDTFAAIQKAGYVQVRSTVLCGASGAAETEEYIALYVHYGKRFTAPALRSIYVETAVTDPPHLVKKVDDKFRVTNGLAQSINKLNVNSCWGEANPRYLISEKDMKLYEDEVVNT